MKKLFTFFLALIATSVLGAKDFAVGDEYQVMVTVGESGLTGTVPTQDELWENFNKAAGFESIALKHITKINTIATYTTGENLTAVFALDDWKWLKKYIMTTQNAQKGNAVGTRTVPELKENITENTDQTAAWRFAIGAFFLQSQYTDGWPATADFSGAGKPSAWGSAYLDAIDLEGFVIGGGTYKLGETATLTATANYGYHFVKWSDDNEEATRTIIVTEDITLTAEFAINTYEVVITAGENGTVSGAGIYNHGDSVTIIATPNKDYRFTQWSDGNTDNPRTLTLTQDLTLEAQFEAIPTYTITIDGYHIEGVDHSTGESFQGGYYSNVVLQVLEGTEVEFHETGVCEIYWAGWSDGETSTSRTIIVTSDTTITSVTKAPRRYTVNITGLSLSGYYTEPSQEESWCMHIPYEFNGQQSLQITMAEGTFIRFREENNSCTWLGWSDGVTDKEREIVITSDTTISANFNVTVQTAVYQEGEEVYGTVSGDTAVNYGDTATLYTKTNYGYHLECWKDERGKFHYPSNGTTPITVRAKVPAHWTDEITVWIWNNYNMYPAPTEKDGDWYAYTHYGGSLNILFRNGNAWYGAENQTIDITNVKQNIWIEITQEGEEKATYTIVKSDPILEKENITKTQVFPSENMIYTAYFNPNIYSLVLNYNQEQGYINGSTEAKYMEEVYLEAQPNYGYHFVQWSDGNTDNPRTLVLTQDTTLTAEFAQTYSGQCGDSLYWSFDDNTLTITGSGTMWDERPWGLFVNEIQNVTLPSGLTDIGRDAFADCVGLGRIDIPSSVAVIRNNCFAGCIKLYDIYCYAVEPPVAYESTFANYNVNLYVPCENLKSYQMDVVFGSFKYIQCIDTEDGASVENIAISTHAAQKVIRNDQLIIIRDDVEYNATGQLVSEK